MPGTKWEDYPEGPGGGSMRGDTRQDTAGSFKEQEKLVWQGQRSGEVGGRQGLGMKGPRIQSGLLDSLQRAMGATDESQHGVCQEGDSGTWGGGVGGGEHTRGREVTHEAVTIVQETSLY